MHSFAHQLQYVARKLMRARMFTTVSIVTLSVGIGANAAIFSVINTVLLKPLPFEAPNELIGVWHKAPGVGFDDLNQSPALHYTYQGEGRHFERIAMWDGRQATITGLDEPQRIDGLAMTYELLPLLRVPPRIGRGFTAEDDSPAGPRTVILSDGYWRTHFGADPNVLGRSLTIEGHPTEIIGVMPERFTFLQTDPDVLLPFRFDRSEVRMGDFSYQSVARMRPGSTVEQVNADIERMVPMAVERHPGGLTLSMLENAQFGANSRPLKQDLVGDIGQLLWVLLGTVAIILLIACANVANLFLVRAEGRQQELAVRTALGAPRAHLAKEFLSESLCLGLLGGIGGTLLAFGGIRLLVALGPESLPRLEEIGIDPIVLAFTACLSVFAGIFFGAFPIFKYSSPALVQVLREGGRGGSAGRERHRARSVLVVVQIALALVLLAGSGLMIRSFQALRNVQPGFERAEEVQTVRIFIPLAEAAEPEPSVRIHEAILNRVRAIPGVTSAGMSSSATMDGWDSNDAIYVEEFPTPEGQLPAIRRFKWIAPGYFETMENPIIAGRSYVWDDVLNHRSVVVVTENLALDYWPDAATAIGKRVRQSPESPWREIVGVVGNVHDDGVDQPQTATVYWPMLVENLWEPGLYAARSMAYVIRSPRVGTAGLLEEVRQAVWAVNPNLPLSNVRTMAEWLDDSLARTSFTLIMLGIAAGVALLLGAVGIYGVISYIVSQRIREMGVRIALGAQQRDVSRLVLRHGLALTGVGVGVGLAAAVALTRLMSALLFGVSAVDPLTYVAVATALTAIALFASWVPARRAARTNPLEALRYE
jgi:predicted permease